METWIGGIITVVTEKYQVDYRNKTMMLNLPQNFWLWVSWWKSHKNWFFSRIVLYKCQGFDWDLDGTNEADICWEVSDYLSLKNQLKLLFSNSFCYQDSDGKNKFHISVLNWFITIGSYQIETLIRNIESIFLQKIEFQNQGTPMVISLFGIISKSISHIDMMEQTLFPSG